MGLGLWLRLGWGLCWVGASFKFVVRVGVCVGDGVRVGAGVGVGARFRVRLAARGRAGVRAWIGKLKNHKSRY